MGEADEEIAGHIRLFGGNLRRARLRSGLTQAQLSVAAPLDRAAISRLECGERAPDLPTLLRVCGALRLEPTDLLRGIGPKAPLRRGRRRGKAGAATPAELFGDNLRWARKRAGISQERL